MYVCKHANWKCRRIPLSGKHINDCTRDIKVWVAKAKGVMAGFSNVWKSKQISYKTKMNILSTCVFSAALFASESWTIKKDKEKIDNGFIEQNAIKEKTREKVLFRLQEETQNIVEGNSGRGIYCFKWSRQKLGRLMFYLGMDVYGPLPVVLKNVRIWNE